MTLLLTDWNKSHSYTMIVAELVVLINFNFSEEHLNLNDILN